MGALTSVPSIRPLSGKPAKPKHYNLEECHEAMTHLLDNDHTLTAYKQDGQYVIATRREVGYGDDICSALVDLGRKMDERKKK